MSTFDGDPRRIKPEIGKVGEDAIESASSEDCDVFDDDCIRLRYFDDVGHDGPEAGALAVEPGLGAHRADVLTREPARDEVEPFPAGLESRESGVNVVKLLDRRPMLAKHRAAVRVAFNEHLRRIAGPPLDRKVEAADAGEQREAHAACTLLSGM